MGEAKPVIFLFGSSVYHHMGPRSREDQRAMDDEVTTRTEAQHRMIKFQESRYPLGPELHPTPEFHKGPCILLTGDDKTPQEHGEFLGTPSAPSRSCLCKASTGFSANPTSEAWLMDIPLKKNKNKKVGVARRWLNQVSSDS